MDFSQILGQMFTIAFWIGLVGGVERLGSNCSFDLQTHSYDCVRKDWMDFGKTCMVPSHPDLIADPCFVDIDSPEVELILQDPCWAHYRQVVFQ